MSTELKPKTRQIPLGMPFFDEQEAEAVRKIFNSPWVLDGPTVRKFEEAFKNYIGAPYAASIMNCTCGLHLALRAFGFGNGDEVILPAFNFVAAGLAVLQAQCQPVFADVDPRTGNLDPADLEKKITKKTKAIQVLHYAGNPAAMEPIQALAKKHGLKIVEDAAHALGASYAGSKIGTHGDAVSFSFGPLKMICTGMGGMVTSKDAAFNEKIAGLRSYGMNKSMWNRREAKKPWQYAVADLGHNFRMTDFQAAMGIVQLQKLPAILARRKQIADLYDKTLRSLEGIEFFHTEAQADPVPLYYTVKIQRSDRENMRDDLALYLKDQGIGASVHWDPPLHLHPLYAAFGYREGSFPATEALTKQILSLPLAPGMSDDDAAYILEKICQFLKK